MDLVLQQHASQLRAHELTARARARRGRAHHRRSLQACVRCSRARHEHVHHHGAACRRRGPGAAAGTAG
eukprot:508042-Prymnesium_polylepis.1